MSRLDRVVRAGAFLIGIAAFIGVLAVVFPIELDRWSGCNDVAFDCSRTRSINLAYGVFFVAVGTLLYIAIALVAWHRGLSARRLAALHLAAIVLSSLGLHWFACPGQIVGAVIGVLAVSLRGNRRGVAVAQVSER